MQASGNNACPPIRTLLLFLKAPRFASLHADTMLTPFIVAGDV